MAVTVLISLDLETHKNSIDGPPSFHLTPIFQVEERNGMECVAL